MEFVDARTGLPLSDAGLAREVGVSAEAVRLWRLKKRRISPRHVSAVSRITGIPRHDLRPDLWEPQSGIESPKAEAA
jgi:DNA-binding transcriptional regulator YdaS (Cro superfamily)